MGREGDAVSLVPGPPRNTEQFDQVLGKTLFRWCCSFCDANSHWDAFEIVNGQCPSGPLWEQITEQGWTAAYLGGSGARGGGVLWVACPSCAGALEESK